MKNAIVNVEYVFLVFQFLQNIACLKDEGDDFQHLFLTCSKLCRSYAEM